MDRRAVRIAIAVALVAAAFGGQYAGADWTTFLALRRSSPVVLSTLAFGLFNALFAPPGTAFVRAAAVAATAVVLIVPLAWQAIVLYFAMWFVWPPAYMVAWALSRERAAALEPAPAGQEWAGRRARRTLAAIIVAVAAASVGYRMLQHMHIDQSAALFIGLPTLLAIVVVLAARPQTAAAVAAKATTVGLLLSMIFLWEGALCVLMSAPLFYLVAIAIASVLDRMRRQTGTSIASCMLIAVFAPMSLEGVTPLTTIDRGESVTAAQIVHAPADEVARALLEPPRFDHVRPRAFVLRAGFPTPTASRIDTSGDVRRWIVQVRGGEMLLNGMEQRTGDLALDLVEARPGRLRWRVAFDTSHMTHYLMFRESIVEWSAIDARTTRVAWTIRFDRRLDPAWYFGPMERYATRLAAGYLIDAVATP
jgi:hypothetical protein